MRWAPEEEECLRKLGEVGTKIEEVLKVFPDRTVNSIWSKAKTMKISFAGPTPRINFEEFKRIIKASQTVEKIR